MSGDKVENDQKQGCLSILQRLPEVSTAEMAAFGTKELQSSKLSWRETVQHKLTAVTCDGNKQITVSQAAHELAAVKHLQQLSAKEEALQGT